ncbi:MAG: hypothetical protein GTO02_18565, partial [Candidatus Dadabacteria bacterium]|nr:hypothetical protein [Candidatus Dadabacteria bacterium]
MSNFLKHTNCKKCGSSDALALYRGGTAYCWSCKTYFRKNEKNQIEENEEEHKYPPSLPEETLEWIKYLYSLDTPSRRLKASTLEKYGVKVAVNEETGEPETHYYPCYKNGVVIGYKIRDLVNKSFRCVGNLKNPTLFGSNIFPSGGKLLIIVEGECDALAASQMLAERGKNYSVVSLPLGANIKSIKDNYEYVDSFQCIMLGLDQDDVGKEATK